MGELVVIDDVTAEFVDFVADGLDGLVLLFVFPGHHHAIGEKAGPEKNDEGAEDEKQVFFDESHFEQNPYFSGLGRIKLFWLGHVSRGFCRVLWAFSCPFPRVFGS